MQGHELAKKLGCDWRSEHPLILPEVWDVASARLLVEAGFPVLTTSASAYAWAQGYRPGERVGLEELLIMAARIVRDCQLPLIADLEGCFEHSNQYIKKGVTAALTIGCKGVIFGDGGRDGLHQMLGIMEIANRVKSARMASIETKKPLLLIARTDAISMGNILARPFDEAVARANAYLNAGADLVHIPGVQNLEVIKQLKSAVEGPLCITVNHNQAPNLKHFGEAGLTAVSLGTGLMRSALYDMKIKAKALMLTGEFLHLDETISENDLVDILTQPASQTRTVATGL